MPNVSNLAAVNIEHHVDRMNAFITLVFGHIILSVLYQSTAHFGLNAYALFLRLLTLGSSGRLF